MKVSNKGFTLVELIVVITILAVLGTVAFISMQSYTWFARNAIRHEQMCEWTIKLEYQTIQPYD